MLIHKAVQFIITQLTRADPLDVYRADDSQLRHKRSLRGRFHNGRPYVRNSADLHNQYIVTGYKIWTITVAWHGLPHHLIIFFVPWILQYENPKW